MKQQLVKVAILMIVLATSLDISAYDFEVDGIYYNITSESSLTVEVTYQKEWDTSAYGYPYRCTYSGHIKIPETVIHNGKEYLVNAIGAHAFGTSPSSSLNSFMKNLVSIEMPSSIKSIGADAFYMCDALSTIIIPSSVEEIGATSFWCRNCKTFIFLSAIPPRVNGTGSQGTPLCIPGEIIVPQSAIYLADSKWNHDKNSYWGGLVEMLSSDTNSFDYDGQTPSPIWTNNLKSYTANISISPMQKNAGSHSSLVKADYYINEELSFSIEFPFEYTINKAPLSVKASDANREYGEDNPEFTYTYSGFVNNENESVIAAEPSIATTASKTSNVGEYPITLSGGSATNYELAYEPGVLAITKAPLSAKVDDVAKVYGAQNPAFTITYYGLKNNESAPAWTTRPTFQTEAIRNSGVGQYEVKAINGAPVNYDLGEITAGALNITPAPLTIKANDATRQYYSDEPNFNYTCSGFVNGDNESVFSSAPVLSTSATKTSDVGTYPISVSEVSSSNYSISRVNGTLTITPRTLVASVGNYERAYNEENPTFEVTYNGFVGNEDESVLHEKSIASTAAIKTSDVGIYPITISGGDADNYQFSYTSGMLTINKAEQEISWEQDFGNENYQVGDQVELQAYATSGLPINYVLSDNNIASLYSANGKVYLDCLQEGTLVIRALQDGNNNYYAAVRKSKTLKIGDASGIETISVDALSSNAPIYDLIGNRVKLLIKGRIYMQNGKKFVAK